MFNFPSFADSTTGSYQGLIRKDKTIQQYKQNYPPEFPWADFSLQSPFNWIGDVVLC